MNNLLKILLSAAACFFCVQTDAAKSGFNQQAQKGKNAKQVKVKPPPHEPVAAGFADWRGFETALHTNFAVQHPSSLRGRFVVVVELEADKALAQFKKCMNLQTLGINPPQHTGTWADLPACRDTTVVFNIKNGTPDNVEKILKDEDIAKNLYLYTYNFFSNLGFEGAPDSGAKYPFVYVMPPEGLEPVFKGDASKPVLKEVKAAIAAARKELKPWREWFGRLEEIKYEKKVESTVLAGKPFAPVMMQLRKDILSKKPEVSREAQIFYDAITQRKYDLMYRIMREYRVEPFVAMRDFDVLAHRWPSEKRLMAKAVEYLDSLPDFKQGYAAYAAFVKYSDPEYMPATAAEAAKAVAELKKAKPLVEKLTTSKVMTIQNVAFTMQQGIDALIDEIPTRVQGK